MPTVIMFVGVTSDPDANLFIENARILGVDGPMLRQVTVTADPDVEDARARVTNGRPAGNAYGAVVRQAPSGFDSGIVALSSTPSQPVSVPFGCDRVFFSNLADQTAHVTLADGDGGIYLDRHPIGPRDFRLLDFKGMIFIGGLIWFCDAGETVVAQTKGDLV